VAEAGNRVHFHVSSGLRNIQKRLSFSGAGMNSLWEST
jgi:hypothetical protein